MGMTRKDEILKLIVEEFVSTAQPVGSNTLIQKYSLSFSSATVRNDMVELENEGYIEKTHASSGRVPSSKGYRYYVDHLKEDSDLSVDADFKKEFQLILAKKSQSVEDVMNKSCEILSEMTNLAAVVLGNDADSEHLISISVVPLSEHAATAIFVTDRGYVENKTFVIHSQQDGKDIIKCVDFLNKRLVGTKLTELAEKIESLRPILADVLGKTSDLIMESFVEAFIKFARDRIYSHGTAKLVELPEYDADKAKLQNVLDLINDPAKLREALEDEKPEKEGVSYSQDDKDDVAILSKDFDFDGLPSAKLAIVGPQRMNYKKIIGTLSYIARELTKYFSYDGKPKGDPGPEKPVKEDRKNSNKED